jgi:hypothetical protein
MAEVTRAAEEPLPEDEVTNTLISMAPGKCAVEVPYNNYGERGYVDLVQNRNSATYITELKSCPKSANKVIRQFQKMKDNFVKGTSYSDLHDQKFYWLVFTASYRNLEHIKQNLKMYESLQRQENVLISMADEEGSFCPVIKNGEINIGNLGLETLKGISAGGPLVCPYCGKEYKVEGYYRNHVEGCLR